MAEPESKASGFVSATKAIRTLATPENFEKLIRALPPETADLVLTPPLPLTWIPSRHFRALITEAHRGCFNSNSDTLVKVAQMAMLSDLKTIYKIFIKLASPSYVIERSAKLWDTYSRGNGSLSVDTIDDHTIEVHYHDVQTSYPIFWVYQRGCIYGVLEATGMKNIKVAVLKGGNTEPNCTLRATWGT